jgi:hypothetical protein
MGNERYWVHSAPGGIGDEEQRPCARGKHCASRDRNHEPAVGPRALCSADRDFLVGAIEALPEMYLELYLILGAKGSGSDGPRVSGGGKTPPIPVRPDVDALMRRIVDVMSSWEERVRLVARLSGPDTALSRQRRGGVAMSTICRMLAAHVDALLALEPEPMARDMDLAGHQKLPEDAVGLVHPSAGWISYQTELDGGDAAVEVFSLYEACKSKLGFRPQHQDLLTPCWNPDCEQRMLRRRDGSAGMDDHVHCRACGAEYAGESLRRLMVEEELAQQRRATKEAS